MLLAGFNWNWFYTLVVLSKLCQELEICWDYNFLVPFGLLSRQNLTQTTTASSRSTTTCWTWTSKRGRNSTEHWAIQKDCLYHRVQLALVFCYFPLFIYLILTMATNWYRKGSIFHVYASTIVYFNSTLNPVLFCWKVREVRQEVRPQWNSFVVSQVNLAVLSVMWKAMLTTLRGGTMASNYSELFYVAALDIKSWTTNEARSVWLHGYIFILYQEALIRIMVC